MSALSRNDDHMMDDDHAESVRPSTEVQVMSPATRAEVDIQVATAKRFPRSIKAFNRQAMEMATFNEDIAAGCIYALPRGGKPIEGPSVRLAEIVLAAWGNVRADARVIDVGAKEITAEGMCWDLEKNIAIRVQVKRRITEKSGARYNDDMIVVTGNAACSIALRNAVFKVVPMALARDIYQAARQTAIGNAETLSAKRAAMVAYFGKMGVTPEQVYAAVDKPGIEDIGIDDLLVLKGTATAIKDGDTTVDQAFPPIAKETPTTGKGRAADLAAKIGATPAADAAGGDVAALDKKLADDAPAPESLIPNAAPSTVERPSRGRR